MRPGHLPLTMLVAGALSVAISSCGDSGTGAGVTGGAPGGATGGASAAGSGGNPVTGGTTATGGGSAQTGGRGGSGGSSETGGRSVVTGGAASGGRTGTAGSGGTGSGGTVASGGSSTGGTPATGGTSAGSGGTAGGGAGATAGRTATGGTVTGGTVTGGTVTGGTATGGTVTGGTAGAGGSAGAGGAGGRTGTGTCTASKAAGVTVSGTGPHKVTVETNADAGINKGTIYRPTDLGGAEKYPIFVWGEGACSQDGLSNQAAMGEIASHGYFVIADGTPKGSGSGNNNGSAMLAYLTWAIAENDKPCSAYYQSLDTKKIAADGFSCGGLMAENASSDPRFTAVGITSSGLFSPDQNVYGKIHTPFKILLGGSADMAYDNGKRDYDQISALGVPIIYFSKNGAGHGGDLGRATGDFNTINLAWLNWQLKGDTGATGKGLLMGPSCKYCTASGWEFKSKNIQ